MSALTAPFRVEDLPDIERWRQQREGERARMIALKKRRRVALGEHVSLLFENRDTLFYQIMEMLRLERTVSRGGIEEELSAYNPLLPDGRCLMATMLIEFEDADERGVQLRALKGIERRVWHAVAEREPRFAVADEDQERSDEEKTSAVHFLRMRFAPDELAALRSGAPLRFGCEHPRYHYASEPLSGAARSTLLADFSP